MASALSHAYVALSLSSGFPARQLPRRWLLLGMACAVVPDIDVIGFQFGIHYGDLLGHRGITHSLAFAAVLSVLAAACVPSQNLQGTKRRILALFLFVATASHGVLDAMTNGGLGVAFFAPFSSARYFLPFRPVQVSPISIAAFFTHRGVEVFESELVWIGIPFLVWAVVTTLWQQRRGSGQNASARLLPLRVPCFGGRLAQRIQRRLC
jgi:inner membrane protein